MSQDYMVSTTAEYYREASKTARTRGIPLRPAPRRQTILFLSFIAHLHAMNDLIPTVR